jgi:hypothetical protein
MKKYSIELGMALLLSIAAGMSATPPTLTMNFIELSRFVGFGQ